MKAFAAGLVVSVLVTIGGCTPSRTDKGDGPSPTTPAPTSVEQITHWLEDDLAQRLRQMLPETASQLTCPGGSTFPAVRSDDPRSIRACVGYGNGQYSLRVENLTAVPITLQFVDGLRTVPSGQTTDGPLVNPRSGQTVRFTFSTRAAVTNALVSYALGKVEPVSYTWKSCSSDLTVACLVSSLSTLLPEEVEIHGVEIPLRTLTEAAGDVLEYAPLLRTVENQNTGQVSSGNLTLG